MYSVKFGVKIKSEKEIKFMMTAYKIYECCGVNFNRVRQYVYETFNEGVPDDFTEDEVLKDFILYCKERGWVE